MVSPLQPFGDKLPPAPRAGFAAGGEAEGGRAEARYVHKKATSPKVFVFRGNSAEGRENARMEKRDKLTRLVVNSLHRCGREDQAKSLSTCGEWFDVYVKKTGEAKVFPCPCNSMFCPDCANRRARPLIKKLRTLVNRKGCSYWFLTLTVPNVENLSRYDITQISEQFAELWNSWVFQEVEDENGKPFRIFGGVRSIECVYEPRSNSWHPHIHVLFEAPRRLPGWWLVLLKTAWLRITSDARFLHLQRAYSVTKRGKKKYNRLNAGALKEVCKYVTKCAEFAGNHLLVDEFLRAFKGVRRIQTFGSFHGAPEQEPGGDSDSGDDGNSGDDGSLRDEGFVRLPFKAHFSDTQILADGTRQLTFEFMERVRGWIETCDPPWELTPEPVVSAEQKRIEFAGAMPEKSERQSSLFDIAA